MSIYGDKVCEKAHEDMHEIMTAWENDEHITEDKGLWFLVNHAICKDKHTKERSKLMAATASHNWKWVMYELIKSEVHDIEKYLLLHDLAKADGDSEVANMFAVLAGEENEHAIRLNDKYIKMPYTTGTTKQRGEWDKEYDELMDRHSDCVAKLTVTHKAKPTATV